MRKRSLPEDLRNPTFGLNKRGIAAMRNDPPPHFKNRMSYFPENNLENIDPFQDLNFSNQSPFFNMNVKQSVKPKTLTLNTPTMSSPRTQVKTPKTRNSDVFQATPNKFGRETRPTMRLLCGGVDKTLQWMKKFSQYPMLFEAMGKVEQVHPLSANGETTFFLSDFGQSPSLQVSYFNIDRPIPSITPGQMLKVVGRQRGKLKLQAFIVLPTSEEEYRGGQHIAYICDCALKELRV